MDVPHVEKFSTHELMLAAVLSVWFPVIGIDTTNPQKLEFIFKDGPELQDVIDKFWHRTLAVEPQRYFSEIRQLKIHIFNTRGNQKNM